MKIIQYNLKKFGYFLNMILYCVSKTIVLQLYDARRINRGGLFDVFNENKLELSWTDVNLRLFNISKTPYFVFNVSNCLPRALATRRHAYYVSRFEKRANRFVELFTSLLTTWWISDELIISFACLLKYDNFSKHFI